MKKIKLVATGLALTLALTACGTGAKSSGSRGSDLPYLSINDEKVSKKDFYKQYDLFAQVQAMNQQLGGQIVNIFQRDYVIKKDLNDNKVEITDEEIKKSYDEAIEKIGGKEAFDNYLDYMNTTKEVFEMNIKANLENTKHVEWFNEKNPVTDEKLKETFEATKANLEWIDTKHILVKTEEEAKKVREELKNGGDFKALSDKYSIDENAKKNGGELGKTLNSQLDAKYVEGAINLEKGETSEPIESKYGYHLIYLNDKGIGYETFKDQLTQMTSSQAHEEYIAGKIKELDLKFYDKDGKEIKEEEPADKDTETNKDKETNKDTEGK